MSTNASGVADKFQLVDDKIGPLGSIASQGLPIISFEAARLELAVPSVDRCLGAASIRSAPAAFSGAFLGCLATLHLSTFGIVPEIASALVTTLFGGLLLSSRSAMLLAREFVPAVYGGAFGGMTSVHWPNGMGSDHPILSAGALFISLSIVCGLAFSAGAVFKVRSGHRLANGYGGRSGAIATVACVLFVQLAVLCGADSGLFHAPRADLTDFDLGSLAAIVAACLAGTTVNLLVLRRERVAASDLADKTFVASAVALAGLIVVRRISPNDALLLDAYYAGCFLGMSSRERLNGCAETMLGTVVLASLILHVSILLPGIGGGLGLAAFVTVAVLVTFKQFTCFVLPANRSEKMATQLPAVRSQAEHSLAKLQLERGRGAWIFSLWRPTVAVAALALFGAMIGGLMWPTQFASEESLSGATTSVSVVDEVAAGVAVPQAEVLSSAVDAAASLSIAEASADSTVFDQTALNEGSSKTSIAGSVEQKLLSAVVDERAAGSDEPNTAPPIATGVTAARKPELGESRKTGDDATEAALFREFLQWRAARMSGVAPTVIHNAVQSHHRSRPVVTQTTGATNTQTRSRRPSSTAQAAPTTSPVVHPRQPKPSNTVRAATDRVVPPSAGVRGSAVSN
jgi:hypothetical protein